MSSILNVEGLFEQIKVEISHKLKEIKKVPTLAIIRVGENKDDISYENSVKKKFLEFSLNVKIYVFSSDILEEDLIEEVKKIDANKEISGILLLKPLAKKFNEDLISSYISKKKDLDLTNKENLFDLFINDEFMYAPCTAEAVIEILKFNKVDIKSKNVVILGRSMRVGKPLAFLFLKEDATVTICHSKTKDVESICKKADILIASIGRAKYVNPNFVNENMFVVDVGINFLDNKICGDVDFEAVYDKVRAISKVPKGVGLITTAILARHLIMASI